MPTKPLMNGATNCRKKCIGKYDPETGEVIPTGRRGRPVKQTIVPKPMQNADYASEKHRAELEEALSVAKSLYAKIESIETMISKAAKELDELRDSADTLIQRLRMER